MSNISIKDVPADWAEALRQRAARNHRSLQGELMAILEAAVREQAGGGSAPDRAGTARAATPERLGQAVVRRGHKTIEQIAAERRQRFPRPVRGGPLAVDIIRADRDSR